MSTLSLFQQMEGGSGYPTDWDSIRSRVFRRDDHTCQRCQHQSGPHAEGDSGRVLQAHHIDPKSQGGSHEIDNLITLCRACHAVQHPSNPQFHSDRSAASVFPAPNSDHRVSFVSSRIENETVEDFTSRKGEFCTRCWSSDDSQLFFYPLDLEKLNTGDHPAEAYTILCSSCLGAVSIQDDAVISQIEQYLMPVNTVGRWSGSIEDLVSKTDDAQICSYHPHQKLCVSGFNTKTLSARVATLPFIFYLIAIVASLLRPILHQP